MAVQRRSVNSKFNLKNKCRTKHERGINKVTVTVTATAARGKQPQAGQSNMQMSRQ